jgi:single-strand DNA-binding protein
MNVAHLLGRVVSEPTLEETTSGRKICKFRLATSNGKEKTATYHNIIVLSKNSEDTHPFNIFTILKPGDKIQVTGRINENRWQIKNSDEYRTRTEIISTNIEFVVINNDRSKTNLDSEKNDDTGEKVDAISE